MNPTGSSEHKANGGMETAIVVVNGVDGLTPDMLRQRPSAIVMANIDRHRHDKFTLAQEFTKAFRDPE